jgi:hypothetical protein
MGGVPGRALTRGACARAGDINCSGEVTTADRIVRRFRRVHLREVAPAPAHPQLRSHELRAGVLQLDRRRSDDRAALRGMVGRPGDGHHPSTELLLRQWRRVYRAPVVHRVAGRAHRRQSLRGHASECARKPAQGPLGGHDDVQLCQRVQQWRGHGQRHPAGGHRRGGFHDGPERPLLPGIPGVCTRSSSSPATTRTRWWCRSPYDPPWRRACASWRASDYESDYESLP